MHRRPKVLLTYAQSLDGRIATLNGSSQWISGPETLELAHQLRNDNDAIMVGVGTVRIDDPSLTCRIPGGRSPLRVIVDTHLRIPLDATVVRTARETPTLLYTTVSSESAARRKLEPRGVTVVATAPGDGGVSLDAVLEDLADRGIRSLLVEGGAGLITSFFRGRLVDKLILVSAPLVIGEGVSAVGALGVTDLDLAQRGSSLSVRQAGSDIVWEIEFNSGRAEEGRDG